MNFHEYQAAALRSARRFEKVSHDLTHASLGLSTETGEFSTIVKRLFAYDVELSEGGIHNLVEELGDVLWYIALAAEVLDVPLNTIARLNIEKLEKRYPGGFTANHAEARLDKEVE